MLQQKPVDTFGAPFKGSMTCSVVFGLQWLVKLPGQKMGVANKMCLTVTLLLLLFLPTHVTVKESGALETHPILFYTRERWTVVQLLRRPCDSKNCLCLSLNTSVELLYNNLQAVEILVLYLGTIFFIFLTVFWSILSWFVWQFEYAKKNWFRSIKTVLLIIGI